MNRPELVSHVALRAGISKRAAADAVDAFCAAIVRAVANGERVMLTDFGTFFARRRKARTSRHPVTGEEVAQPSVRVPAFRPAKAFRTACRMRS